MSKSTYFPAIHTYVTANDWEASCVLNMTCLLTANLVNNGIHYVSMESPLNPINPLHLHNTRLAFLKAVAGWPDDSTLELRIISHPDLAHMPKGQVMLSIILRCRGNSKVKASETLIARYMQLKALLSAHFHEADFSPIFDSKTLKDNLLPFTPTHALALRRREEMISLAKLIDPKQIGFTTELPVKNAGDHRVSHVFPWVPSHSNWHRMIDYLLWQIDPMMVLIRIRSAKITESEQHRLTGTIETCEAYLTNSKECKTVLIHKAEILRDLSLSRLFTLRQNAMNAGVFIVTPHQIDSTAARLLGVSITEESGNHDRIGLFTGGFTYTSIPVESALDSSYFVESDCFTVDEAACAFRLPSPPVLQQSGLPIKYSKTSFLSLPKGYLNHRSIIVLGTNQHRGIEQTVGLRVNDRMTHLVVWGQSGVGKSTLIESMILQDIRAGRGLCLIDPSGELAESILGKVPSQRADDIIYFDLMDRERPIGFNLIEYDTLEERDLIIDTLYCTLDRIYSMRETGGPIFEKHYRSCLSLLMGNERHDDFVPTLLEFPLLYLEKGFRDWLKKRNSDPQVHDFLQELERTGGEASLNNVAPYITSKFSRFINDSRLRRIIGQEHTPFDFREIMDHGKILLVSLGKGRFGETVSSLIAGQIVSRFKTAAMSRADQAEGERKDFFLYIDEFENLPKEDFGELLSEARKYKLGLVLVNQFTDQLKGASGNPASDLLPAVLGNVGTVVVFRVGIQDADKLSPVFYPVFDRNDLANLPNYHAYACFRLDGASSPAFSFKSQKDQTVYDRELASHIRTQSKLKYGTDVAVVDAQILRRRSLWKHDEVPF